MEMARTAPALLGTPSREYSKRLRLFYHRKAEHIADERRFDRSTIRQAS